MYTRIKGAKTTLRANKSYVGETIEEKVRRIMSNKEPIKDGAPLVYTDRSEGVVADYNIRTDRWELAVHATDAIAKSHLAKRQERHDAFKAKLDAENQKLNKPKDKNSGDPSQ